MDRAWELWQKGEYPGQHLWGATHLSKHGIEVEIVPYQTSELLHKIGRKLGLGDHLDQQLHVLFHSRDYDAVYSACQTNTLLLALMRSLNVFHKPLVALIHHPCSNASKESLFLNGHDRLLCLSEKVMEPFVQDPNLYKKMDFIAWGADLLFYDGILQKLPLPIANPTAHSPIIVSAGKTERDHDTLVQACLHVDCTLRIYCSANTTPRLTNLPDRIEIHASTSAHNAVSYPELGNAYRQAFAIAIPLTKTHNLAGLTSLLDAMAVGKPVIMTRNPHIEIDVEKEGIGLWVEPEDVHGWQQAIAYLIAHPEEAIVMGDRARYLCEKRYNLDVFTDTLARTLHQVSCYTNSM